MDPLYTQLTLSAIATWALERAKASPYFPWLSAHTKTLNRVVAVGLSGLTSLGVTFTGTGGWQEGGTLLVTIPSVTLIGLGLWHWLQSFVLQQMLYHAAVKPQAPRNLKVDTIVADTVNLAVPAPTKAEA